MAASRACPKCGQPVQQGWRYCPDCRASLQGEAVRDELPPIRRRRSRKRRQIEREAIGDTAATGIALMIVGFLGIFAAVMVALASGWRTFTLQALLIVALGLLVMVAVGLALTLRDRSGKASTIAGTATGIGSGLAVGCLMAVLCVLALFSTLIMVLQTCSRMLKT